LKLANLLETDALHQVDSYFIGKGKVGESLNRNGNVSFNGYNTFEANVAMAMIMERKAYLTCFSSETVNL